MGMVRLSQVRVRMNVSVGRLTLRLSGSFSLKDKRRVVSSARERVRRRFNVSIAEVDAVEEWQTAVIGIACVSNSVRLSEQVLERVVEFIEAERPDAEVVGWEVETLTGF